MKVNTAFALLLVSPTFVTQVSHDENVVITVVPSDQKLLF